MNVCANIRTLLYYPRPGCQGAAGFSHDQFRLQGNLLRMIRDSVRDGSIQPNQLEIEVTEGCRIPESISANQTVSGLVSSGIAFSMDDYGTGFSSLETLNRLPFSAIKR